MEEADVAPPPVLLDGEGEQWLPGMTWMEAAELNADPLFRPTPQNLSGENGRTFAFQDLPHSFNDQWRDVWLLTGEDGVTLWTRDGHLIDEPDDGVANGFQTWASFADDWENEYYRLATASPPPAAAAERVPATADTGAGAGDELEEDDEEDDEAVHEVPGPEAPPPRRNR